MSESLVPSPRAVDPYTTSASGRCVQVLTCSVMRVPQQGAQVGELFDGGCRQVFTVERVQHGGAGDAWGSRVRWLRAARGPLAVCDGLTGGSVRAAIGPPGERLARAGEHSEDGAVR